MGKEKWLLCPVCGNKTRLRLRVDTVLAILPQVQTRNSNHGSTTEYVNYKRARRTDAEPIKS